MERNPHRNASDARGDARGHRYQRRPASAPPLGTRSEVEWIGRLKGARMGRVDEHLYRQRTLPLWHFLMKR
jgi:hypothetical protein